MKDVVMLFKIIGTNIKLKRATHLLNRAAYLANKANELHKEIRKETKEYERYYHV